ncbi:MAG: hypothetical protein ACYC7H_13170, partial [Chloroflexota bacterium]
MKRYTARFATSGATPAELRARLCRHLDNSATIFRLGQVVAAGPDAFWVELATDEPRFHLERQLASLPSDAGLRLEQV